MPSSLAQQTRQALAFLKRRAKKRLSQHFLTDPHALRDIVAAAQLTPDAHVLEIGPGLGALTAELCRRAARVLAVEIDPDLCAFLRERFAGLENLELLQGDFLKLDLPALLSPPRAPWFVVADIPYALTTPIINRLLDARERLRRIVLMVQEEVAQRMVAAPGSKTYGALSVRCQYAAEVTIVRSVSPNCFYPPPAVRSAIVVLVPRAHEPPASDELFLQRLVQAAFGERRKMAAKAIASRLDPPLPRALVERAFAQAGVDPAARAEQISVAQWVALANILKEALAR